MPPNDGTAKCTGTCERTLPLSHLKRCIFCDKYICTSTECSTEEGSDFYSCVVICSPRVEELEKIELGRQILNEKD